jgi:biopolymer transport protein ExbB
MKHTKLTSITIILALLFLGTMAGFAQEGGDAAAAAAKPQGESIVKVIMHGGPLIIAIWLAILGTSVTMVTFVIQNLISLRKEKLAPSSLVNALHESLAAGNYQQAWDTCNTSTNYLANVLQAGLTRLGRGKEAVEDAIAEHSLREAQVIRTRNSYLSVIGVISPMIGLLGTVIGMMGAFATLGASGISDPRGLATSIGEVLMATASGLFIAIPAFIFYYIFRNRSQMVIVHADDMINQLIADIPFDQLEGVHVGENAGAVPARTPAAPRMPAAMVDRDPRRLSSNLQTTKCPNCNGLIVAGQNPCSHCGATLDWAE